jgi:hypothetical protein
MKGKRSDEQVTYTLALAVAEDSDHCFKTQTAPALMTSDYTSRMITIHRHL